ncbi:retrotransposon protein, putative, ty1-copia subclass [Tanacetum coccineum]
MFVIEQLVPPNPPADSAAQFENSSPYDILQELKFMFEKQTGVERFDLIQTFHACKQEEGNVGLILNGLTGDFVGFVRNYNMHNMGKTICELHALLIEYEKGLPKKAATPQVMTIQGGRIQKSNKKLQNAKRKGKGKGKGKDKPVYIPKCKTPKPSAKEHPTKDEACHHCKEVGHWKRNCPVYLAELIKKKKQVGTASSSVGNGVRAQVKATGSFDLILPNGIVICLDNCHYAPTITRGVVSVSRLVHNGFIQCFTDYGISVSKNDVLYFNAIPRDGIYEIDMLNLVPNLNSIYNVSYFITFTDDYSRYGYVYLLKHKHEVFETFKLTPPYTLQHNGVSERRNRTLLDMVRSMMNLTTLPLSFWDYALESASRILNDNTK